MKRYTAYLLLVFCVAGLPLSAEEPPKMGVSEESWDFGAINEGDKATHIFKVTNIGGGTLSISKVRSSCGCTAAVVSKRELEKNQTSEIKATFNSKGRSGPFKKTVYVHSNDSTSPVKKLALKGNILSAREKYIKFIPSSWNIGLVQPGTELSKELRILNIGMDPIHLSAIKNSKILTVKGFTPKELLPGRMEKITLKLSVPDSTGKIDEKVVLFTSVPQMPTIPFFVKGFCAQKKKQ